MSLSDPCCSDQQREWIMIPIKRILISATSSSNVVTMQLELRKWSFGLRFAHDYFMQKYVATMSHIVLLTLYTMQCNCTLLIPSLWSKLMDLARSGWNRWATCLTCIGLLRHRTLEICDMKPTYWYRSLINLIMSLTIVGYFMRTVTVHSIFRLMQLVRNFFECCSSNRNFCKTFILTFSLFYWPLLHLLATFALVLDAWWSCFWQSPLLLF